MIRLKRLKCLGIVLLLLALALGNLLLLSQQQGMNIHENNHRLPDGSLQSNGILYHSLHSVYLTWVHDNPSTLVRRAPAIGFGVLTLLLTFKLGSLWGGCRLGAWSVCLLASNILFLSLCINHRFYALNMFLCVLSTILWWRSLQDYENSWRWALYSLSLVSCLLSMCISATIAVAHAIIYIICCPRHLLALFRFIGLALLMLAVLGALFWRDSTSYDDVRYPFSWDETGSQVLSAIFNDGFVRERCLQNDVVVLYRRSESARTRAFLSFLTIAFALAMVSAVLSGVGGCFSLNPRALGVLAGLILSIGWLFVYSSFMRGLITINNLSWSLPFISILLAWGVGNPAWGRGFQVLFCFALVLVTPIIVKGSYAFSCGCAPLRQTVERFRQPHDMIIVDGTSTLPGLLGYGKTLHVQVNYWKSPRPSVAANAIYELQRAQTPLLLTNEEVLYFLKFIPEVSSLHGRRIWLLHKFTVGWHKSNPGYILYENYTYNQEGHISVMKWTFPEGEIHLLCL